MKVDKLNKLFEGLDWSKKNIDYLNGNKNLRVGIAKEVIDALKPYEGKIKSVRVMNPGYVSEYLDVTLKDGKTIYVQDDDGNNNWKVYKHKKGGDIKSVELPKTTKPKVDID